jgi:hypothetical protein
MRNKHTHTLAKNTLMLLCVTVSLQDFNVCKIRFRLSEVLAEIDAP